MMKQLEAVFLPALDQSTPLEEISASLDKLERNRIDEAPWPAFNYKPKVNFALAHGQDCLFLKFNVSEEAIRAVYAKTHEPVYKDSCVEMFIAFKGEKEYYNLEFNLLGTCLSAYGSGRENRKGLPEVELARIKSLSLLSRSPQLQPAFQWQLTLMIPLEVFCFHEIKQLKETEARANFFKCGDDLPNPHFLSWNNIVAEEPDFHLPAFFGNLHFV